MEVRSFFNRLANHILKISKDYPNQIKYKVSKVKNQQMKLKKYIEYMHNLNYWNNLLENREIEKYQKRL